MMTIADLMRICLEFDQQQLTSRPSPWGIAAEHLARVCDHAESSLRDTEFLGDWHKVDLSPVRKSAPRTMISPTMDLLERAEKAERKLAAILDWARDNADESCLFEQSNGEWAAVMPNGEYRKAGTPEAAIFKAAGLED